MSFEKMLLFHLDDRLFAIPISKVERVVRMVEITPLPEAPDSVLGVVNVAGTIAPVLDMRRRFRLPERAVGPGDYLIISSTSRRTIAIVMDTSGEVLESEKKLTPAEAIGPDMDYVRGVLQHAGKLVLVLDLERFSLEMKEVSWL